MTTCRTTSRTTSCVRWADLDHPSASFDDIAAGIPDEEGEDERSAPGEDG